MFPIPRKGKTDMHLLKSLFAMRSVIPIVVTEDSLFGTISLPQIIIVRQKPATADIGMTGMFLTYGALRYLGCHTTSKPSSLKKGERTSGAIDHFGNYSIILTGSSLKPRTG